MSLTELRTDVDDDARLHLPDLAYDYDSTEHRLKFDVVPMDRYIPGEEEAVGVRLTVNGEESEYLFSEWSRQQLLSLLGTRERWFSFVTSAKQAQELNDRTHALTGYNFRTSKAVDEDFPVRFVRGIVSRYYTDIPNSDIMAAVVDKMPEGTMALRHHSGLTDRAFYAYLLSPTPVTIPGTRFYAYPGMVVKNSDVGFTSLYVIPMLVSSAHGTPVVLETKTILKRIHRGQIDLREKLAEAFDKCSLLWSDLSQKLPHLASKKYATSDDAIEAMERVLTSAGATRAFIQKCQSAYKKAPRGHSALDIFDAISEVCAEVTQRDDSYTSGAIAGAVLFRLLF